MFEPDESNLMKKGVLSARAVVSTESGKCPVRLINMTPDPVQHYREESYGEIPPAEELERVPESKTTEKTGGRVSPITIRETTAPLLGLPRVIPGLASDR